MSSIDYRFSLSYFSNITKEKANDIIETYLLKKGRPPFLKSRSGETTASWSIVDTFCARFVSSERSAAREKGRMDGRMDGRTDGWMDGWKERYR